MPADYTILQVDAQDLNFDTTDGVTGCIRPTEANAVLLALYQSLPDDVKEQIHQEMAHHLEDAVGRCFVRCMKNFAMKATGYQAPRYARER